MFKKNQMKANQTNAVAIPERETTENVEEIEPETEEIGEPTKKEQENDLNSVLYNHENRIIQLEAALNRIRGAI